MNKLIKCTLCMALLFAVPVTSNAQGLGDLLKGLGGGGNSGDLISNVIEGVFTKTNISVADLTGNYVSKGPAITFKSDNFLQKAGGLAGAATIESKLQPYYDQYGLTGATLDIDQNANFKLKVKAISLSGTITKNESDGTFDFNFNVLGMKIGKFTTYVEKSGSNLNVMFDATKFKDLISKIAGLTGNSMAKTLSTILDSYDGACIGFKMVSTSSNTGENGQNNSGSAISSGLDALKGLLNKGN